ncbi:hypothetical protein MYSTI_02571 [Myxococcus stipitatus DSM 14675]|uniref:DUF1549 domain-containing protein n=1 Tax=Myxococcus stipitatus (strain DSM 14675 / JCM 12634 / Mx s8) TaxID=1278073 RepID=L7U8K2_MYXSD|nr:hypothetical protein MYSTI_02571 [Myxococcus stipitatus DSM 14675]
MSVALGPRMLPCLVWVPDARQSGAIPTHETARLRRSVWWVLPLLACVACSGSSSPGGEPDGGSHDAGCETPGPTENPPVDEKKDTLAASRLLRRASLALRGVPPTDAEYAAQEAAGDEAAQRAFVDSFVDRTLHEPLFYRTMFEKARDWFDIPVIASTADAPEYGAQQQRTVELCKPGTAKAGAWKFYRGDTKACDGLKPDGTPADETTLEPWWAPGTTVTLVGYAGNTSETGITMPNGTPTPVNCRQVGPEGTCGCGPNAVRCHADHGTYPGHENFVIHNAQGQRRLLFEEPARLFAHLAWYDRPATDLILGTYSVGPTRVQAAYVSQALAGGLTALHEDDSWWRPERYSQAPIDPEHTPGDPYAWREYSVPARNPFLIADRDYRFDPRTQTGAVRGVPAAGILTSIGFLAGYPRERLRGARALEILACEVFSPPQGQTFNEYRRDPGTEGTCQHCHRRLDPAAIHFKRYAKHSSAFEGWGAKYFMPGVGTAWHWPVAWRKGQFPYGGDPYSHWNRWYQPDTLLTPVTEAQATANPESLFIDFLPSDQTLLGQVSDGTIGPLGFAKLIVASGSFDRCVVRHMHAQVMGRDIDPAAEAGYLEAQVKRFVEGGRKIRPYVKSLTQSNLFKRGH